MCGVQFVACGFNLDIYCPSCHDYHTFESSSTAAQQSVIAAFSAGMTYVEYQQLLAALDLQPPIMVDCMLHKPSKAFYTLHKEDSSPL